VVLSVVIAGQIARVCRAAIALCGSVRQGRTAGLGWERQSVNRRVIVYVGEVVCCCEGGRGIRWGRQNGIRPGDSTAAEGRYGDC
jgi:hypothetical protein